MVGECVGCDGECWGWVDGGAASRWQPRVRGGKDQKKDAESHS